MAGWRSCVRSHPDSGLKPTGPVVSEVPIGDILTIPGHPSGDHLNGTYVPVEEPSTASEADLRRPINTDALGWAGMMEFELIPFGPLKPLGVLLSKRS